MKRVLKISNMFLCGILAAVIIYPLLHEVGHMAAAGFMGVRITDIGVFPLPFVECEFSPDDSTEQLLVGLSGTVFPYVISMFLNPSQFWLWYTAYALKITSVYATIYSLFSVLFYLGGVTLSKNDIAYILQIFPNGSLFLLVVFILMSIYGIYQIIKQAPLKKCLEII